MTATATSATPDASATRTGAANLNSRLSRSQGARRYVPKPSGKPDPTAHLSAEQVEALARELDELRQQVFDSRGERDANYIRTVIKWQRGLEMGSRAVLLFSLFPPAWVLGTAGLSIAKILEDR
jgi:linoleoyl-CoA desaturase